MIKINKDKVKLFDQCSPNCRCYTIPTPFPYDPEGFCRYMNKCRKVSKKSIAGIAKELNVCKSTVLNLEKKNIFYEQVVKLKKISKVYNIPYETLLTKAGFLDENFYEELKKEYEMNIKLDISKLISNSKKRERMLWIQKRILFVIFFLLGLLNLLFLFNIL